MNRYMLLSLLILPACTNGETATSASAGAAVASETAYAQVIDAAGALKARAVLTRTGPDTITVEVAIEKMAPGTYAVHIHQSGTCTPPDFTSAGGHWNPTGARHGFDSADGAHKGDLPNATVGADGRGMTRANISGVVWRGSDGALLDADGAAIVLHRNADDYRTDPAGNAGPRLACGPIVTR